MLGLAERKGGFIDAPRLAKCKDGYIHIYLYSICTYMYIYILFALRLLELLCFVCPVDLRNLKKYVIQRRKHT